MNLKNVIVTLDEIWGEVRYWNPKYYYKLIRAQLNEIKEDNFTTEAMLKEIADIINISISFLHENYEFDDKDICEMLITRAKRRYAGNTKKILDKYNYPVGKGRV